MAFYLLTWTYFNDVNGRNILINSQLKRILFISSGKRKGYKTEKDRKNMEKEDKTDGSDLVKMRYQIQILWSLLNLNEIKNIGDIDSSSSDNEEEGAEAVVWRCSAAGSVENMS